MYYQKLIGVVQPLLPKCIFLTVRDSQIQKLLKASSYSSYQPKKKLLFTSLQMAKTGVKDDTVFNAGFFPNRNHHWNQPSWEVFLKFPKLRVLLKTTNR